MNILKYLKGFKKSLNLKKATNYNYIYYSIVYISYILNVIYILFTFIQKFLKKEILNN